MAETHVVSALIAKRAELAGQLDAAQAEVRRLIIDLDNLDATLRLFKPDIDLAEIKPKPLPPRAAAYKGEVARIVLGTLRSSPEPMTTEQLAEHVMAERNLNAADKRMLRTVSKRVGSCLRHYRAKGVLTSSRACHGSLLWSTSDGSLIVSGEKLMASDQENDSKPQDGKPQDGKPPVLGNPPDQRNLSVSQNIDIKDDDQKK